jgi:hypothetical protein
MTMLRRCQYCLRDASLRAALREKFRPSLGWIGTGTGIVLGGIGTGTRIGTGTGIKADGGVIGTAIMNGGARETGSVRL